MAMGGFIFGAPGLPKTPEELARMRAIVDAMAARPTPAPHNIGEGLTAIGNALAYRSMLNDLNTASANIASQQAGLGLPPLGGGAGSATPGAPAPAPSPATPVPSNVSAVPSVPADAFSPATIANTPADLSVGGKVSQNSAADLTNAVAKLESGNSPVDGPSGRYVNYRFQQFPAFAKQYGSGEEGVINYAKQVLAANPNATFGDMYGGYVTGTGNPATARMASLQTTTQPGAQGAFGNLVRNSPIDPKTPLSQLLASGLGDLLGPASAYADTPKPGDTLLQDPQPAAPVQAASLGGASVSAPAAPVAPPDPRQQITQLLQSPPVGQFTPTQPGTPAPSVTDLSVKPTTLPVMSGQQAIAAALQGRSPQAPTPITPQGAPAAAAAPANAAQLDWARKVLQSPYASKTQQALAGEILKQAMAVDKPTNDIINYRMSVSQGFKGTFDDWLKQRALLTKSQTIAPPEKGMRYVYDQNGNVVSEEPIPGSAAQRQAAETAGAKQTTTDVLATAYKTAKGLIGPDTTGIVGKGLGAVLPPSQAAELRRQVHVLTSNASIEALNAMRRQSPTGGALGNVTEAEERILAATAGAINPDSSPAQFKTQLDNYYHTLLRIVNGPEAGDRMFRELQQGQAPAAGAAPANSGTTQSGIKWSVH